MPYLIRTLVNGKDVGLTNGEIVLPISSISDLDVESIGHLVKELENDYLYIKNYLGGDLDFKSIDEAKEYIRQLEEKQISQKIKRQIVQHRRTKFNSRQKQLLLALINRDGYICQHKDCRSQDGLTIDHIIPLSKGGSDDLSNLQLLCKKHNSQKGDKFIN